MKKNLLEEISRIKNLIVYEVGTSLNEVTTTSSEINPNQNIPNETPKKSTEKVGDENKELPKENCAWITKTTSFPVDKSVNEGAKEFLNHFKKEIEKEFKDFSDGKFLLRDISVFGGASNYNGGVVPPKYCNEYDTTKGVSSLKKWAEGCKGFDANKKYGKSNKTKNETLALNRAKSVLEEIKKEIIIYSKENQIVLPENFIDKDIKYTSGTVYTLDKIDENNKSKISNGEINPGQIVMINAQICFKPNKPIGGSCPDVCMKKNEDDECECPEGMKKSENGETCICIEGEKEGCSCKKKVIEEKITCDYSKTEKGKRATAENNYVGYKLETPLPSGVDNSLFIKLDSLIVPDAFYLKYGDQEFWSGFLGEVSHPKFLNVALGVEEKKNVVYHTQPKYARERVDNDPEKDYSSFNSKKRNFIGELVIYKERYKLLENIKKAVGDVGGTPSLITSIFGTDDGKSDNGKYETAFGIGKRISQIEKPGTEWRDLVKGYKQIIKKEFVVKLNKESKEETLYLLVFSPLGNTEFTIDVKCR